MQNRSRRPRRTFLGPIGGLVLALMAASAVGAWSGAEDTSQGGAYAHGDAALPGIGSPSEEPPAQGAPPVAGQRAATPDAVQTAVADLAERLGVDPATITVLSVDDVTWSDSSLGCPEPGRAYSQVVTPGQRIRLEADGAIFEYHGGRVGAPRYCENPEPPISGQSSADAK